MFYIGEVKINNKIIKQKLDDLIKSEVYIFILKNNRYIYQVNIENSKNTVASKRILELTNNSAIIDKSDLNKYLHIDYKELNTSIQILISRKENKHTKTDCLYNDEYFKKILIEYITTSTDIKILYSAHIAKYNLVGVSKSIHQLRKTISKVLHQDINLLIQGETGTGKELIAKAVYDNSKLKNGRYIAINCASMQESIFENELFGHVSGAFTGAKNNSNGLMLEANDGLLFLDEIVELSLINQAKLLRVIQEKKLRQLGSSIEKNINFNLISASHQNINELVKNKLFREDLMYRINEYSICIDPLRKRNIDIPILIEYYLNILLKTPFKKIFSNSTLDIMCNYLYPGNVRELISIIKVALIESEDNNEIKPMDIHNKIYFRCKDNENNKATLKQMIKTYEKDIVFKTLKVCEGKKTKAAKLLSISNRTLQYKLKEYALNEQN